MDVAPNKPGWLSGLGDWLGGVIEDVASAALGILQDIGSWVAENASRIAAVGNVLAAISAVFGAAAMAAGLLTPFLPILAPAFVALTGISAGYAGLALVAHGTAWAAGEDVPLRTFGQDILGVLPLAKFVGGGGRIATALGDSALSGELNAGAFWDSLDGLIGDPSALGFLKPRDQRQQWQMFLPSGAGALWVGFENAWRDGGTSAAEREG
ncbi:hypothetical protein SAMN06297387_108207 [Streptomyces zhaozhouensis]|uniref:Uncharacterized protein n=2 Tax=Streptomyces zhaozhouensis TaxID=1300267 RepID=A0A286DWV9_9ACTN|nr:hypothetical protein SAMN06297387_108207 [Streptomyces zhaozhouensis]